MILNSSDYYFNHAYLMTTITEEYLEFKYNYNRVTSPKASDLYSYFEEINGKYYQTTDNEIKANKSYYTREVEIDDNGDPLIETQKEDRKAEIKFGYIVVDPSDRSMMFLLDDVPGKAETLIIKTSDNISPKKYSRKSKDKMTDRVRIDNKIYTIANIYQELGKSSNTMFGKPKFTTYLVLEG